MNDLFLYDKAIKEDFPVLCGVDEAGRGPLCGPVCCAAVVLKDDFFCDEMTIPVEHAYKQTHTYIDELRSGVVTDYLGVSYKYRQKSCIHIEKTSFRCNLLEEFIELIGGIAISQYSGKPFIDKNLNKQLKTTIYT